MRRTAASSAFLWAVGACSVGLFLVLSSSSMPDDKEKVNPRIKELQKKRLAVLEKIHDLAMKGFGDGISSVEDVHTTKVELLTARLDYADTRQDRIKACDEAVKEAIDWQKIIQQGVKAKALPQIDELKAQSFLLEAQITQEKTASDE